MRPWIALCVVWTACKPGTDTFDPIPTGQVDLSWTLLDHGVPGAACPEDADGSRVHMHGEDPWANHEEEWLSLDCASGSLSIEQAIGRYTPTLYLDSAGATYAELEVPRIEVKEGETTDLHFDVELELGWVTFRWDLIDDLDDDTPPLPCGATSTAPIVTVRAELNYEGEPVSTTQDYDCALGEADTAPVPVEARRRATLQLYAIDAHGDIASDNNSYSVSEIVRHGSERVDQTLRHIQLDRAHR